MTSVWESPWAPQEESDDPIEAPRLRDTRDDAPPRWRDGPRREARAVPGAFPPPRHEAGSPRPHPSSRRRQEARARLSDQAMPVLQEVRARLEDAQHRAVVQDLAGVEPPSLRFLLWPRLFPTTRLLRLDASPSRFYTLEIAWGAVEPHAFSARYWPEHADGEVTHLAALDDRDVDDAWFRRQVFRFVEAVLERV